MNWLRKVFGVKERKAESLNEGMISIGVPANCQFQWLVQTIAIKVGKGIEFHLFEAEDLSATFPNSFALDPQPVRDLISRVGLELANPLRYVVEEIGDNLVLTKQLPRGEFRVKSSW